MTLKRQAVGSELVSALEDAWDAIRARHPELPAAVLIVGSGSQGRARGLRLGHFAARRWWPASTSEDAPARAAREAVHDRLDAGDLQGALAASALRVLTAAAQLSEQVAASLGEVFIAGEGLARDPEDVLATLLHEAAHAIAHERGLTDTSRQGRYHNRRFRQVALELGLHVERHPQLGWTLTTVPEPTVALYAAEIAALDRALTAHRSGELSPTEERAPKRNGTAAVCDCGRRIRAAPAVLALGPVICGVCRKPFRER
jgi:hypothetical protein